MTLNCKTLVIEKQTSKQQQQACKQTKTIGEVIGKGKWER